MNMTVLVTALAAAIATPPADGDVIRLPAAPHPRPALRHLAARGDRARGVVLFIHGATFPSALSFAYPIEGRSWMRDLCDRGFDVWALDFAGYGEAERDSRMQDDARAHPPLGRARDVLPQIEAAVAFIRASDSSRRLSIVAHSWGTVPAAMYVTAHPQDVERFVMYGPIVAREEKVEPVTDAWILSDARDQWQAFLAGVPAGRAPAIERVAFDAWMERYLASDPTHGERETGSVKVPAGPVADFADMMSGKALYDPAAITVPTLVLRGEWDAVTTENDATALYAALTAAPIKRMVWINGGTHRIHLERSRQQVYREVRTFLEGEE
jgi:alpha-beta hydrolase superfamily lysophospholipase